ncbi:TPA: hypothetical protein ACNIQM_001826 [Citrobacter werkmanii]
MTNSKGYCGICADCVPQINGGSGFNNCEEAHAAQMAEDKAMNNRFTDEQLQYFSDSALGVLQRDCMSSYEIAASKVIIRLVAELQERRKALSSKPGIAPVAIYDRKSGDFSVVMQTMMEVIDERDDLQIPGDIVLFATRHRGNKS